MKRPHILIVDDELSMREFLEIILNAEGYHISTAQDGKTALKLLKKNTYDLVITDLRLGDMDGLMVLREVKKYNKATPVIIISAYATAETAVKAMKEEAFDYVPKPFNVDEMKKIIKSALSLKIKGIDHEPTDGKNGFYDIIGNNAAMKKIFHVISRISKTKSNVLITGESGTGKELIAKAIQKNSANPDSPFVTINCAGIPEPLIESELFGYKKGAFTGAIQAKKGLFEVADKGTIFLDEIAELSPNLQAKLLRVVQEKTFKPIGGTDDISVNTRIISATNRNLEEEVIKKNFREDLYYRLNVIKIHLPPLRERPDDIHLLANHFLKTFAKEQKKDIQKISSYAIDILSKYNFPGNIRELENIIERGVALETSRIILPESLTLSSFKLNTKQNSVSKTHNSDNMPDISLPQEGVNLQDKLDRIEREYIFQAIEKTSGHKQKAAQILGLSFRSFRYRLKKITDQGYTPPFSDEG